VLLLQHVRLDALDLLHAHVLLQLGLACVEQVLQRLLGVGAVGELFEGKLLLGEFGLLVLLLEVELLDLLLGGLGALGLDRLEVAFLGEEVVAWLELELLG
jgi:hypothetical protein